MISRPTSLYLDPEDMIACFHREEEKEKAIRLKSVLNEQTGLPGDVTNVKIVIHF